MNPGEIIYQIEDDCIAKYEYVTQKGNNYHILLRNDWAAVILHTGEVQQLEAFGYKDHSEADFEFYFRRKRDLLALKEELSISDVMDRAFDWWFTIDIIDQWDRFNLTEEPSVKEIVELYLNENSHG